MQSAKTHHHSIAAAVVALVAACSMILPAGVASAAQAPGLSVKQGAGYTATKISHPNAGLGENDGIVNMDANGTPSTPQPSPSPAAPSKPAADKAGKTSAGKTDGTTANTGSAVFGVAFAAAVLVLAAGVMLKLRRRD